MRIMFVAPFGMGRKTTVWARTLPLAMALADLSHEVRILVPPWDSPAEAGTILHDRQVAIHRVDIQGGLMPIVARMLWEIRKFRPDILHFVKPRAFSGICQWLAFQSRMWALRRPALILLDTDDWEQAWTPQLKTWPWIAWFLAWQEEWGLRHCDGVTAASQWLWRRAGIYAPALPRLYLPNGTLAGATPRRRPRGDVPTVLWFTRFVEVDPAWMAAFWSEMRVQVPDCRLLVAGTPVEPGLDKAFRQALAVQSQDLNGIEWLGYVEPETLPDLYAHSHCAIVPARESAANLAKCSVRMLGLIANGLPCVASQVGEQIRFADSPLVTLLEATASSQKFAAAVADKLRQPVPRQDTLGTSIPTWSDLALHLDNFYRTLYRQAQP